MGDPTLRAPACSAPGNFSLLPMQPETMKSGKFLIVFICLFLCGIPPAKLESLSILDLMLPIIPEIRWICRGVELSATCFPAGAFFTARMSGSTSDLILLQ